MVTTFVLRLLAERLTQGEVVGQVEHIASGRTATVHSASELESFARTALLGDEEEPGA